MLDPFRQALTTRNVVPPHSVSLITSSPVPGYFLENYDNDDDDNDDIITEFSTSFSLLVL